MKAEAMHRKLHAASKGAKREYGVTLVKGLFSEKMASHVVKPVAMAPGFSPRPGPSNNPPSSVPPVCTTLRRAYPTVSFDSPRSRTAPLRTHYRHAVA